MEQLKLPTLRIAFATVVLLCFGFLALAFAEPAAAEESTPLTGATVASQDDNALATQANHTIKVKLNKTRVYVGSKPSVTGVTVDGKAVSTSYFTFSGKIPSSVGKGSITATSKSGTSFGKGTTYFYVMPYGTSLGTIEPVVGGFTASWGSQTSYTAGYQLQISKNSNFSSAKKVTISDKYTTSRKVTGLEEGKVYYVRIRTFASTYDGNIYSPWSSYRSVVTKAVERSPYEPTQKLKFDTLSRNGRWCYIRWSEAKSWYYDSGAASSKVSGYELQWDDNKSFSSPAIWTTKSKGSYSHTIETLTPGTTYYFRVRLWNTVNAKTYYGPWSDIRSTATASQPVG